MASPSPLSSTWAAYGRGGLALLDSTIPATTVSATPIFDFSRSRSGLGTTGSESGMQPWGPVASQETPSPSPASSSTFEQDVNGDLMPIASPVTRGLFEIDENGDIMPATTQLTDTFFELDENGDIEPKT